MTTAEPFEITFMHSVERATRLAAKLLRSDLGASTHEDVVSLLIEKACKAGKSEAEILEALSGPGLYRRLANAKNDLFRQETARKRGGREPIVALENAEPFVMRSTDNLETELVRKEDFAHMKDVLTRLIQKVELSETQMEILELDRIGYSSKRIARELEMDIQAVYARRSEALRKLVAAANVLSKLEK